MGVKKKGGRNWLDDIIVPTHTFEEAITQLSQPSTVEEVRVLLEMAGYLKKFIPNYSSVLAPISDFVRDSRSRSKKVRRLKVPWGQVQTEAMETLVSFLTSPPISALPHWNKSFRLHTDASKTGAGAVLTQMQEMVENPLAYASHPWSKTDKN